MSTGANAPVAGADAGGRSGRFEPLVLVAAGLAAAGLIAGGAVTARTGGAVADPRALNDTRVSAGGFPKEIVDPSGRAMTLRQPPVRIVSTLAAIDEVLVAIVPKERIVGLSYWSSLPFNNLHGAFPAHVAKVQDNAEAVLALAPDIVFVASYNNAATTGLFMSAGVPVVRLGQFDNYNDIKMLVRVVGEATGEAAGAVALLERMDARLRAVGEAVAGQPRPKVLYWQLSGWNAGEDTTIDQIIQWAGGENLGRALPVRRWVRVPEEWGIAQNPEVMILPCDTDDECPKAREFILTSPLWRDVPAVKTGRVHAVRSALLTAVSQYFVNCVEAVAGYLHPGVYAPGRGTW